MRVKLPFKMAVQVRGEEITLLKQSRKYHIPDEEVFTMTPDEAVGLALILIKSAQGNILVGHPDKLR